MGDVNLKKGDIILKRGTGRLSSEIEFFTHSQFSHAALVSDPEKKLIIEASLNGVGYTNLAGFIGFSTVYRMMTLTDEQASNIVTYAEQQLGKPYDYEELVDMFLRYVFHIPNNRIEKGRYVCSTFVNACYGSAGIKLTKQNLPSPEDIFESPLLTKVADI
ncbi:YiiX/YebB-like N1pC/P60 family cysteine hydrolase [Neobacillus ginsengisoli]|uniref:Uncharacterized protein YycO n=1 Tax=Neobacillus ginsengisoli TaxID=904295 RepID=A0ABT9XQQ5_9BACI|nr:YiiX/YebB-like N1pC/P60 family cysteine hydrolase [Neobacillus ginsengisoli]MDQ0197883.1 uncharacterized protein YycO [Neobacillus ginsengisoli]